MESIQLLNTAIIKSKEKKIDNTYEERLNKICETQVMTSLTKCIADIAETEKISRDQAAVQLIETIRELDQIWSDYVTMEGIDRLKNMLKGDKKH